MRVEKAFPTTFMCHMLQVSTAEFYAWLGRPPSQRDLDDAMLGAGCSGSSDEQPDHGRDQ
jgi:hypothetical protein